MKKVFLILLLICLCSISYSSQLINIHKLEKAPVIDGVLDDECYKNCAVINYFLNLFNSELINENHKVYISYDENNLYFGIKFYYEQLKANSKNRKNPLLWSDDHICLYIMGNDDYYLFGINGNNSVYMGKEKNPTWYNGVEYKTVPTDYGWSGEIRIPFSVLGIKNLKEIKFNITGAKGDRLFTWADLSGGTYHNPEKFGTITLDESKPIVNIDNILCKDNKFVSEGKILSKGTFDYSVSVNDKAIINKTSDEIKINENFDSIRGLVKFSLSEKGKVFYETGFITGIYKMDYELKDNNLKVIIDFADPIFGKYSKIGFYLKDRKTSNIRDAKVYFGETVTFLKPFKKEIDYKLKNGQYDLILEIWSLRGLEIKEIQEIDYL